jgi:hypothetical protein
VTAGFAVDSFVASVTGLRFLRSGALTPAGVPGGPHQPWRETPASTKEVLSMSDYTLDQFDSLLEEDPMGPFGTGPAVEDDSPFEPVEETDFDAVLFEQFGDFDAFGPFRSRYEDYSSLDDGWPYPDLG